MFCICLCEITKKTRGVIFFEFFILLSRLIKGDYMKKIGLLLLALQMSAMTLAQKDFKGGYHNMECQIRMVLNLEKADIPIPGLELDSCYGYLQGRINSSWIILKVKEVSEKSAVVRVMCEKGDVAEDIRVTLTEDGADVEQIRNSYIKGVENRKYVKLPKVISFKKD